MTKTQRDLAAEIVKIGGDILAAALRPCVRPVEGGLDAWRDRFVGHCSASGLGPAIRCAMAISMSPEILSCARSESARGHPTRLNALLAWFAGCADGLVGRGWALLKTPEGIEEFLSIGIGKRQSFPAVLPRRKQRLKRGHAYQIVNRKWDFLDFVAANRSRYSGVFLDVGSWLSNYHVGILARVLDVGGIVGIIREPGRDQELANKLCLDLTQWKEDRITVSFRHQWSPDITSWLRNMVQSEPYYRCEDDFDKVMKVLGESFLLWRNGNTPSVRVVNVLKKVHVDQKIKNDVLVCGINSVTNPRLTSEADAWKDLLRCLFVRRKSIMMISEKEPLLHSMFEGARLADLRVFIGKLSLLGSNRLKISAPSFVEGIPSSLDRLSERTKIRQQKGRVYIESLG